MKTKLAVLVEKFQCPGCMSGSDTSCGSYKPEDNSCQSHVAGTSILGRGNFALGLPKGFNKCGLVPNIFKRDNNPNEERWMPTSIMNIRLWENGTALEWNNFNVPVWAMVVDGFLFVRTYSPRVNFATVDVVEGGTLDMVPQAMDISKFIDEMD